MSIRFRILISVFCLGVFATLAQVVFMREMLVAFFGNELTIGTILASWLVGISLGAFMARLLMKPISDPIQRQRLLACLLIVAAVAFPAQIYLARIARILLHVPAGEYTSFGAVTIGSFLVCLPSSFAIGLFFPFACKAGDGQRTDSPVGIVYTLESLGSMIGGILLTYLLLPALTPYRIVLIGGAALIAGAGALIPSRISRDFLLVLAIGAIALAALYPTWLRSLEDRSIVARWRAFGMLSSAEAQAGGSPPVKLVQSLDTIYQNLAITESEGQYALYGNGQVMSVFPDPIGYEHSIHFVMAQKPDARKVLLLGGNPVGDIPELLKYRIQRLVYVDLDPGVGRIIRRVMPDRFDKALADPRIKYVPEDAPRFVRNCRETFDVILINAPEPATVGANRFYTQEFYVNIRRILSSHGFVYTAATSSERLQSEALNLGASVYQTLTNVFPVVLVTAEARNRFFACRHKEDLTFDRDALTAQSRNASLTNQFFRPEYFSWIDVIDKDKLLDTKERFSSANVPLNTSIRPVTCFYNLILWSRYSGSNMDSLLNSIRSWNSMIRWPVAFAASCLIIGALLKFVSLVSRRGTKGRFSRVMIGIVLGTTGFCGIAFEILLIFVFQSIYGYVYARIGLIVAVFMAGLVIGAPSGKTMIKDGRRSSWLAMAGIEITLLALALALPFIVKFLCLPGMDELSACVTEILIYATVGIVGWCVGSEFIVANKLFCDAGGEMGSSAAATDAWDHIGAALGALLMGVFFIPVFGIGTSCMILVALKAASLFLLAAALLTMPQVSV